MPRARMGVRGPGPNQIDGLCARCPKLVFPISSHRLLCHTLLLALLRRRRPDRCDGEVCARRAAGPTSIERPPAVPLTARADPPGAERRLRGHRHQPLQRAVEADRRGGDGAGRRRADPHPPCRSRGRLPRRGSWPPRTRGRSRHLHGIVPCRPNPGTAADVEATAATMLPGIKLLRPLAEYEQVAGSGW